MISVGSILLVLALVIFMLAAFGVPSKLALVPLGLAVLVLSALLERVPFPHL